MSDSRFKSMVAGFLHHSGALVMGHALSRSRELHVNGRPRLRKRSAPRFVVLCYHRVGSGGIPFYSELPTAEFEKQMRYLRKYCRIVTLDELVSEMRHPGTTSPAVAVTFDDGYAGTYTEAYPILKKYSIPATVYLTVGCIETGEPAWYDRLFLALQLMPSKVLHFDMPDSRRFALDSADSRIQTAAEIIRYLRSLPDAERLEACAALESGVELPESELRNRMLTWDQVREMHRHGIRFEAHTMTHPVLSRLGADRAEREIADSKDILEQRINAEVRHFAYPFGHPNECGTISTSVLSRLGFQSAATTIWGTNSPLTHPFCLRRVQIGQETYLPRFACQLTRLLLEGDNAVPSEVNNSTPARVAAGASTEANRA